MELEKGMLISQKGWIYIHLKNAVVAQYQCRKLQILKGKTL